MSSPYEVSSAEWSGFSLSLALNKVIKFLVSMKFDESHFCRKLTVVRFI